MVFRGTKTTKIYRKRRAVIGGFDINTCSFCKVDERLTKILRNEEFFYVIENAFPYDIWDGQDVVEHLMIIPKRHVQSVGEFNINEENEFHKLIKNYESEGYSVYFRHKGNVVKSMEHQHTHLLKLDNKRHKYMVYIHKPYLLWWK